MKKISKVAIFVFLLVCSTQFVEARDAFQTILPAPDFSKVKRERRPHVEKEVVDFTSQASLDVVVEGVFWDIEEPRALISGQIYKDEDVIAGTDARIMKIQKNKVTVLYGGAMVELKPYSNL